jgi:dephospho-CoA kinase
MGGERRHTPTGRAVVAIGLTGSIGAGKTTALSLFQESGALVFSADKIVHELYEQREVAAEIAAHFGPQLLSPTGTVDRKVLAAEVQGRPKELLWLEDLIHPLVAKEIGRRVGETPEGKVVVCEVPLLFGSGYEALFDLIVTVEAGSEIRRRRSVQQFDLHQFTELEALQLSREERMAKSDLVFVNDGNLDQLREFVRSTYETARGLLETGHAGERA